MFEKVSKESQLVSEHPRLGFESANRVGPETGRYIQHLYLGFSQVSGKFPTMLFHSFIVKYIIFSSNFSILVASSIQVYQVFKHNTVFTIKSNVYFSNFSIIVATIIQIIQLSTPCYFIYS